MPLLAVPLIWLAVAGAGGAVVGGTVGFNAASAANKYIPWAVAGALAFYIYKRKV